ncbi:hypothetical protein [Pseudoduganella violaceinigra]|uniref:hypothetical protein n=1 Tax=Pseudoduganella violaceinigra TaxID=246602 RepID=UPI0012B66665|nr:hypothetical protein [Pseudoduganella violaceinigra]
MQRVILAIAALALSACATKEQNRIQEIGATPLRDLNIAKVEIPDILRTAMDNPYKAPAEKTCPALLAQVADLDEELGPDIDAPEEKLDHMDASKQFLEKEATGALQRTVEGAIPFRGWLRKLSGAERASRHAQSAVLAGKIRRGYLKGIMESNSCQKA